MKIDEIHTVCFVGAGTMGCYNAIVAAVSGYDVVLYDRDEATLAQVTQRQQEFAAFLVGGAYCSEEDLPPAFSRVSLTTDLVLATAAADLVSESVFEQLEVKRDIHRRLDKVCPPRTILTTNSSALQVSEIEDVVGRGDRFAALHSHLGAPLVDIVPGPRTTTETVDILTRYVTSLQGIPLILKKEHPGYVLNAMLGPVLRTALQLVLEGGASLEAVDRAWIHGHNAPMGPFGMMDLFGLNLILDKWLYRKEDMHSATLAPKVIALLRSHLERDQQGIKSGQGFYSYPDPAYQQPEFKRAATELVSLQCALDTALIGNAIILASIEVAEPVQINRAWKIGTSLDSGPFDLLQEMGEPAFCRTLADEVAAGRFDPAHADEIASHLGRTL